jgi:hypothetical protein
MLLCRPPFYLFYPQEYIAQHPPLAAKESFPPAGNLIVMENDRHYWKQVGIVNRAERKARCSAKSFQTAKRSVTSADCADKAASLGMRCKQIEDRKTLHRRQGIVTSVKTLRQAVASRR